MEEEENPKREIDLSGEGKWRQRNRRKRLGEGVTNLEGVIVKGDDIPWRLVQLAHVRLHRNGTTFYTARRREQKRGKLRVLADPHHPDFLSPR